MSRPKIELVRLSSSELRSLPPLNFVQLCVQYTHLRMETYVGLLQRSSTHQPPIIESPTSPCETPVIGSPASHYVSPMPRCPRCVKRRRSCAHLLQVARQSICSRFRASSRSDMKSLEDVPDGCGHLRYGTKSCEDILRIRREPLAGSVPVHEKAPFLWREATRSEEHLSGETAAPPVSIDSRDLKRAARSQEYLRKYTIDGSGELIPLGTGGKMSRSVPSSPGSFWSRKSATVPDMTECDSEHPSPDNKPRRSVASLLRRLHPRLLPGGWNTKETRTAVSSGASSQRRPWIVVEFQDVDLDVTGARPNASRSLETFSSVPKISLLNNQHRSSRERSSEENLLDGARRARSTTNGSGKVTVQAKTVGCRRVPVRLLSSYGCRNMPADRLLLACEPRLTTARIIMEESSLTRHSNGSAEDELDRVLLSQRLSSRDLHQQKKLHLQHADVVTKDAAHLKSNGVPPVSSKLTTSPRSSETVKQAVRLLAATTQSNGDAGAPLNGDSGPHTGHVGNGVAVGADKRPSPSYVGISCSVSGYSQLGRYGSAGQRQDLVANGGGSPRSSREQSPAPATAADRNGGSQAAQRLHQQRLAGRERSVSADDQRVTSNGFGRPGSRDGSPAAVNGVHSPAAVVPTADSPTAVTRSFVQARIERLYGPGALCSGFRRSIDLNRSLPNRLLCSSLSAAGTPTSADASSTTPAAARPAVFRHLRAEFRQQLPTTAACVGRHVQLPADTSPTQTVVPPLPLSSATATVAPSDDVAGPAAATTAPPRDQSAAPQTSVDDRSIVQRRFIEMVDAETSRILALATRAENDLNSQQLTAEIEGRFRAALGKARLLIAQKFQQFRGLCEKNYKQPTDDPFPTTLDDLQGFWDMVLIQVEHIDQLMQELDTIRNNDWTLPAETAAPASSASLTTSSTDGASRQGSGGGTAGSRRQPAANSAAARARALVRQQLAAQRRRMVEEKRRALMLKKKGIEQEEDEGGVVEIFLTDEK